MIRSLEQLLLRGLQQGTVGSEVTRPTLETDNPQTVRGLSWTPEWQESHKPTLALLVFEEAHPSAALALEERELVIGRGPDCDIRVRDKAVSRKHCTICRVDGHPTIIDNGSTNGTVKNGKRVEASPLEEGDVVTLGNVLLKIVRVDSPEWRVHRSLFDQIYTDELTGLLNRRGFRMRTDAWHATVGDGLWVGLLMLDADLFKNINDHYGHPAGDAVIAAIGQHLREVLPINACAARIGGEEFGVFLADTNQAELMDLAEEIRVRMESKPVVFEQHSIPCTLSIGATLRPTPIKALHALFAEADAALYQAKAQGRNRCVLADSPPPDTSQASI